MAFRKHMVLALALLALTAITYGCVDSTAPTTQDESPVLPPTNVRAAVVNGGDVQVSWDPSSQPSVTGYNVYRGEVNHGNPQRINGPRIQSTQYLDRATWVEKQYEYRVTAVDSKGKESRFTSVVVQTNTVIGDGRGGVPIPIGE